MQKELESRAVAYLNVDIAVQGNHTFRAMGVPSLRDVIYEAAMLVENPDQSEFDELKSVYESWKSKTSNKSNIPKYKIFKMFQKFCKIITKQLIVSVHLYHQLQRVQLQTAFSPSHSPITKTYLDSKLF